MPIDGPFDSGYKSPCHHCPYGIEDELCRLLGSKQAPILTAKRISKLREKCQNCKYRIKLAEAMDKDPVSIPETDFPVEQLTSTATKVRR